MISHIVAASENNIIGSNNELPWKLSTDFKYFKNKTWGMPVIMGRNSFDAMKKALPGRINIVVTRKQIGTQKMFLLHMELTKPLQKQKKVMPKKFL